MLLSILAEAVVGTWEASMCSCIALPQESSTSNILSSTSNILSFSLWDAGQLTPASAQHWASVDTGYFTTSLRFSTMPASPEAAAAEPVSNPGTSAEAVAPCDAGGSGRSSDRPQSAATGRPLQPPSAATSSSPESSSSYPTELLKLLPLSPPSAPATVAESGLQLSWSPTRKDSGNQGRQLGSHPQQDPNARVGSGSRAVSAVLGGSHQVSFHDSRRLEECQKSPSRYLAHAQALSSLSAREGCLLFSRAEPLLLPGHGSSLPSRQELPPSWAAAASGGHSSFTGTVAQNSLNPAGCLNASCSRASGDISRGPSWDGLGQLPKAVATAAGALGGLEKQASLGSAFASVSSTRSSSNRRPSADYLISSFVGEGGVGSFDMDGHGLEQAGVSGGYLDGACGLKAGQWEHDKGIRQGMLDDDVQQLIDQQQTLLAPAVSAQSGGAAAAVAPCTSSSTSRGTAQAAALASVAPCTGGTAMSAGVAQGLRSPVGPKPPGSCCRPRSANRLRRCSFSVPASIAAAATTNAAATASGSVDLLVHELKAVKLQLQEPRQEEEGIGTGWGGEERGGRQLQEQRQEEEGMGTGWGGEERGGRQLQEQRQEEEGMGTGWGEEGRGGRQLQEQRQDVGMRQQLQLEHGMQHLRGSDVLSGQLPVHTAAGGSSGDSRWWQDVSEQQNGVPAGADGAARVTRSMLVNLKAPASAAGPPGEGEGQCAPCAAAAAVPPATLGLTGSGDVVGLRSTEASVAAGGRSRLSVPAAAAGAPAALVSTGSGDGGSMASAASSFCTEATTVAAAGLCLDGGVASSGFLSAPAAQTSEGSALNRPMPSHAMCLGKVEGRGNVQTAVGGKSGIVAGSACSSTPLGRGGEEGGGGSYPQRICTELVRVMSPGELQQVVAILGTHLKMW